MKFDRKSAESSCVIIALLIKQTLVAGDLSVRLGRALQDGGIY